MFAKRPAKAGLEGSESPLDTETKKFTESSLLCPITKDTPPRGPKVAPSRESTANYGNFQGSCIFGHVRKGIRIQITNVTSDPEGTSIMATTPPSRCWNIPRRYILAIMCNLAFFLRGWTITNLVMIFYHLLILEENDRETHFPTLGNFTQKDNANMQKTFDSAFIIGQIPAAIIIILVSPYQIMQYSMILSAFLQLITPWTIQISTALFFTTIFIQGLCACPLDCASIGLWKEWAPSTERTGLLMVAFSGQYIYYQISIPLCLFLSETVGPVSLHYFAGIAGVIWCILWNNLMSGSPSSDPLISKTELKYITDNVPLENKENISLSTIPLKSILKSLPVLALCFVFLSSAVSSRSMVYFVVIQAQLMLSGYNGEWMVWVLVLNCILTVPAAGYLVDFLINRKIAETTTMRKIMCSGGLSLHAIFTMLFMVPDTFSALICLKISLLIFPFTLAGALPNVLDLSPRFSCVIMGAAMTVFSISRMLYDLFLEHLIIDWSVREWIVNFIPVEMLAIWAAILFAVFGSGKEQVWSCQSPSSEDRTEERDSQHYPQTNLEDEVLISERL
ncbi:hypothetical protein JTE90_020834 [Oedothorax gibbosus]|uniref:Uncharacterized protein n=1 Tax=Oedothorax gibbosus TaxID=931172 RepID=A0AAV6U0Q4_9ARAC|nr:hypothetical protein JTE90_020834 [Oedothorax gibbosus]